MIVPVGALGSDLLRAPVGTTQRKERRRPSTAPMFSPPTYGNTTSTLAGSGINQGQDLFHPQNLLCFFTPHLQDHTLAQGRDVSRLRILVKPTTSELERQEEAGHSHHPRRAEPFDEGTITRITDIEGPH